MWFFVTTLFCVATVPKYYEKYSEQTSIPSEFKRQDGIYFAWDRKRIFQELTQTQQTEFEKEIKQYNPVLYAFLPYQTSLWNEINEEISGVKNRRYLGPGVLVGLNRQRLADSFDLEASRYTNIAPYFFVMIHFENAKPDQGRKTVQEEVSELAKKAADRALQYAAKQRDFLKPVGDDPTPGQREVEKDHEDWKFNVMTHARERPLSIPPIVYQSEPRTEQDVIGLFNQICVMNLIPGIQIYSTSQIKTYDSLIKFDCSVEEDGLRYIDSSTNPLGVSPFILGDKQMFETRYLTIEYKLNLDLLLDEVSSKVSKKDFTHIDINVCWTSSSKNALRGYEITEVSTNNIDERKYPGVTHLLAREGDSHVIQVISLNKIIRLLGSGISIQ